jgi:hypothetical protein
VEDKELIISTTSAVAAKYGTATTTAMAGVGFLGWFSTTEWLSILGFALGVISFCYDLWNKGRINRRQELKAEAEARRMLADEMRAQEEHMIRMQTLKTELANEQLSGK